jgi:hypothetical protein
VILDFCYNKIINDLFFILFLNGKYIINNNNQVSAQDEQRQKRGAIMTLIHFPLLIFRGL